MNKLISVVVPVYNEERNISVLYGELADALKSMGRAYEIMFVDDGSSDGSLAEIKKIALGDPSVRAIAFKRNYGQTSAIVAGIDATRGDYVITIDADLQNDPQDIRLLMRKIEEGSDLATGWRRARKEPFFTRRLPSLVANRVISFMTGLKLHDYGCTLKIYKREYLKNINLYGEMHRFIPLYVYWMGGRIAEVEVSHRQRRYGRSKYGMGRTMKVIFDLITVKFLLGNYSTSPLYFFGSWGAGLIFVGVLTGAFTLFQKFMWGFWVHKNPLLLLSVFLFIVGLQAILLGLLAELSMRIYYETTRKSIYTVKEKIGC